MEIKVTKEAIQESHLLTLTPSENDIQICAWCGGWWPSNEMPRHNIDCKKPYQGP